MSSRKLVLITGVARGLGASMAKEFARMGHTVLGCSRSAIGVEQIASSLGAPHSFRVVNVADDNQVQAWSREILGAYSAPDLLLNNAAVINRNAPLWDVTATEFSDVIDTNVKGVANVIRHFVPAMISRRHGLIVNFSSGWGRSTSAEVAPYCATKWAVEALTQALAQELPSGMAAVPLNPGIINTDMLRRCFGESAAAYPSPAVWAQRAVPFILSLGARHNGQPLTVPL